MKPDPCPLCGANRNLVGRRHNCMPTQAAKPSAEPVACKPDVDNDAGEANRVDNANGKMTVINISPAVSAQSNAQRQAKWQAANRDKHRERNRDLMRQKRASERAATSA